MLDAYLSAPQAGDSATTRDSGHVTVTADRPFAFERHDASDEAQLAEILTTTGGDESLQDGDHPWFSTSRRQPSGAWRIGGGGSGP